MKLREYIEGEHYKDGGPSDPWTFRWDTRTPYTPRLMYILIREKPGSRCYLLHRFEITLCQDPLRVFSKFLDYEVFKTRIGRLDWNLRRLRRLFRSLLKKVSRKT